MSRKAIRHQCRGRGFHHRSDASRHINRFSFTQKLGLHLIAKRARADELIDIYQYGKTDEERIEAMHELDALIQDEAFYIPFWDAPFLRFLHWDHVRFPEFYLPKRTQSTMQWQVFWVDEERRKEVEADMDADRAWPVDPIVDIDPYHVKDEVERAMVEGEK